ncbi:MAG: hypothetical protein NC321_15550 [Clostridium sp.]|nr:hypothetical protein [Lachnoclostridium sp.]MCM1254233.1 hypothetical protein [Clostridium sp.]
MKVLCEKNALLESKAVVEDYAEDIMNYGSKYVIFAVAEKSQSFRKVITEYVLSFRTAGGIKEFKVNKQIYDSSVEGAVGDLYYSKRGYQDFKKVD